MDTGRADYERPSGGFLFVKKIVARIYMGFRNPNWKRRLHNTTPWQWRDVEIYARCIIQAVILFRRDTFLLTRNPVSVSFKAFEFSRLGNGDKLARGFVSTHTRVKSWWKLTSFRTTCASIGKTSQNEHFSALLFLGKQKTRVWEEKERVIVWPKAIKPRARSKGHSIRVIYLPTYTAPYGANCPLIAEWERERKRRVKLRESIAYCRS